MGRLFLQLLPLVSNKHMISLSLRTPTPRLSPALRSLRISTSSATVGDLYVSAEASPETLMIRTKKSWGVEVPKS